MVSKLQHGNRRVRRVEEDEGGGGGTRLGTDIVDENDLGDEDARALMVEAVKMAFRKPSLKII